MNESTKEIILKENEHLTVKLWNTEEKLYFCHTPYTTFIKRELGEFKQLQILLIYVYGDLLVCIGIDDLKIIQD